MVKWGLVEKVRVLHKTRTLLLGDFCVWIYILRLNKSSMSFLGRQWLSERTVARLLAVCILFTPFFLCFYYTPFWRFTQSLNQSRAVHSRRRMHLCKIILFIIQSVRIGISLFSFAYFNNFIIIK